MEYTGITQEVMNLDELFSQLPEEPMIANDMDTTTEEGRAKLNALIYTKYDGDSLSTVPQCTCGYLSGGSYEGMTCPKCGTDVVTLHEKKIESVLWLRPPQGVKSFINPLCYQLLKSVLMEKRGYSVLDWLTNTAYQPTSDDPPVVLRLMENNIERGLNYFCEHFDEIIDIITYNGRKNPLKKYVDLLEFISMYRDAIFCQHIPMPSNLLFVVEENETGRYTDKSLLPIIDALRNIVAVSQHKKLSLVHRQNRTAKANAKIAEFYVSFIRNVVCGKNGMCRQHLFGARTHFSARAVITSLSEPHHYTEVHLPWSLSIQLYSIHISNRLLAKGMSPRDIENTLNNAALKYNPMIHEILNNLMVSCPYIGLPILLQRNPTLAKPSAQLFYVTNFKTDVEINSISMSSVCLAGPNADFDGDALNLLSINDTYSAGKFEALSPHAGALDYGRPRTVSRNLKMPTPIVATIANWLNYSDEIL